MDNAIGGDANMQRKAYTNMLEFDAITHFKEIKPPNLINVDKLSALNGNKAYRVLTSLDCTLCRKLQDYLNND